ncbi:MAG: hypothetical protein WCF33_09380, partial [Pseudonocardiaceae bacterium]
GTDLHHDCGPPSLARSGYHRSQPLGQLGTGGQERPDIAGRPYRRREKAAPAATESAPDGILWMRAGIRGHRAQCHITRRWPPVTLAPAQLEPRRAASSCGFEGLTVLAELACGVTGF